MKPVLTGSSWLDSSSLRENDDESGVLLWWLGQAGFLIEMAGKRIVIDAYLSDSLAKKYAGTQFPHIRMMPAPVAPEDLKNIDIFMCTHAHTDHMDPDTIAPLLAANPNCRVVIPASALEIALARGVAEHRCILMDAGGTVCIDGLTITATPSAHEELLKDKNGYFHFLGYVLKSDKATIWHSGDTIPYAGLAELLQPMEIDLALLPVNGRDATRAGNGVPGNLTFKEALDLGEAIGVKALLAHHFGMFEFNTIDPKTVADDVDIHSLSFDFAFSEVGVKYDCNPKQK